ncbi:1-deoxy-D-xylulose-5-phosphate reductoisomerase [Campylobacter insulaenigrae]|uniref:1-deoxy-D-xylulose 5-phosphate reductoisomerase n=1 Tax=Campylobacter insulaenigrae TaxID=260714 RepID=A0ABY3G4M9_9BACT|nr:1-deoxy-D-xylulose-5-phosphate reductoisomerase [Campylobacter insulaenigrae]MCR6571135.1 1-deoxy-D-xylulose-5-phosphate reductoisomerase [Campylobacter insulaenigrae]MCR6572840.1 1-deoxy-D-xylulose-5-phosphate reductoisomerase [Campylobacter insulaenigrae]MCR6574138.1 1-deoxy-D-xylulose-5-phosphate reductoisomerase [Campylobacter insulaenigrae]MCR6577266.1 1-deoxy-D-xylulose-5-phosphate reductoisomerase [Campylobacter insulaenigrae]MCR6580510.1 1-deoxy-D-xylulose-5-phosphate reductoisomera
MILLGSTGSIGVNTLFIAECEKISIEALSCGKNIKLLNEQIAKFKPKFVCIQDPKDKILVNHDKVFCSQDGLKDMISQCKSDLVVNAIVGFAGLNSSLMAQKLGKSLALANKESLVVAGKFFDASKIRAIDSEHAALKCLIDKRKDIKKLYITASGGAFYKYKIKDLKHVSPKEALKHPNWSMGAKITIDSASMCNKLFEIIEAYHLYGMKNIDALIERKSLVHALCEFEDGGISAYFSHANMRLSIAQAILKFHNKNFIEPLNLSKIQNLKFEKISLKKYPIFTLKDEILKYPDIGVIINSANEYMVYKFLEEKVGFLDIAKGIFRALDHFGVPKIESIDDVFEYDMQVKLYLDRGI